MKLVFSSVSQTESIRKALFIGGIPFSEKHVSDSTFAKYQATGAVLIHGNMVTTQKNAILRYCGKLSDLYPTDELESLHCDELIEHMREFREDVEQNHRNKQIVNEFNDKIEQKLEQTAGRFCVGDDLTIADLELVALVHWVNKQEKNMPCKGMFDGRRLVEDIYDFVNSHNRVRSGKNAREIQEKGGGVPKDAYALYSDERDRRVSGEVRNDKTRYHRDGDGTSFREARSAGRTSQNRGGDDGYQRSGSRGDIQYDGGGWNDEREKRPSR